MKPLFICLSLILFTTLSYASDPSPQSPGPEVLDQIARANQAQAELDRDSLEIFSDRTSQVFPFAEYEQTGYVFFNDDEFRGYAKAIKRIIAQNLPEDVTLVVYSTSGNQDYLKNLRGKYSQWVDATNLVILKVPRSGSNNFWTRDNLPLPVWTNDEFTLVDARYYYNFEPDDFLINLFQSLSSKHNYFFEGGNFIANARGECIVVNRRRSYPGGTSDTAAIPDGIFRNMYGCKKLTRLKHLKGIGHADEVVKFMTDDVIVTDTDEYVPILKAQGYKVVRLPEAQARYATYVNSLQVNNVLFVPEFNDSSDSKAVDVYNSLNLGLQVVTAPTRRLATGGQGGIHCITMNYPPVPMTQLIRQMGATIIH